MLLLHISIFIISCIVLVRAGTWVVKSLIRIAQALEWSGFIVSFILMAFATSFPELVIGLTSAFHHRPELSFGNVIGSNVINLTLAVGLAVILCSGLSLKRDGAQKDSLWTALFAFLPVLMILDGSLSRVDGVVLLIGLGVYLSSFFKDRIGANKALVSKFQRDITQFKIFLKDIGIFFGSLALLLLSAQGVVWASSAVAQLAGIPLVFIGITIVALGTNLPEIVFGVRAISLGRKEMVLGNLMGSVVANSTLVLGLTCLIYPLRVSNFSPFLVGIFFTVISALFFYIFSKTRSQISKREGIILLIVYFVFIIIQILLK